MHMSVVMVAGSGHVTRFISIDRRFIVCMVVTVLVAVVPKMCGVARRVLQRIADTHHRRVGGVQREHDDEKKSEASAHGGGV